MTSSLARIREDIELTSPDGEVFIALWAGSDRKMSKKLGRFGYPDVKGNFVQDLEVGGISYPMTIFFDGIDHDKVAKDFFKECSKKGTWDIKHPMHGDLILQLVEVTEKDQPITSGNIIEFDLEFIVPSDTKQIQTTAQAAGEIDGLGNAANEAAANQFSNNANQDSLSNIQALKNGVKTVQKAFSQSLKKLSEGASEINSVVDAINRGITDTLDAVLINSLSLAGQIQALMQTPALIQGSIESKLEAFQKMFQGVTEETYENPTSENKNLSAVKELTLSACIVGVAQVATNSDLNTRLQAIESADYTYDFFNDITNNLDNDQNLFINNAITNQYFSQSEAFGDHLSITGLAILYLLKSAFDLKIEKRFILDRPRSPLEITITEYNDDTKFDEFIETNQLKNNDILSLSAGREVVVYV